MAHTIRRIGVLLCVCALLMTACVGFNNTDGDDEASDKKPHKTRTTQTTQTTVPEDDGLETVDISGYPLPDSVVAVQKNTADQSYIIQLNVKGYQPDMVIQCTVSADGVVTDAQCLSSNETIGQEKTYGDSFIGKDAAGVDAVDFVMGATYTTKAYKDAIKDALNTATILGGADIDLRSPEQILQDNLMAALPGSGNFGKVFLTEVIEGIDAIYEGSIGYVAVIGDEFVGVDPNGTVLDATVKNAATIEAEMGKVISSLSISHLTGVDLTAYEGIHKTVRRITKTASGNYIVEVNGLGFGYYGDESHYMVGQNIPIVIRVSLTPEGRIIDTLTVSHSESKGYGAACGEEAYYGQFDGKTVETYQEVDGIAGATITTNGYMKAIQRCFEAVAILEGGAQ